MTTAQKQLLFDDLDDLAFAAAHGKFDPEKLPTTYTTRRIGPLLELLHLSAGGHMPSPKHWLTLNAAAPLVFALEKTKGCWIAPARQHTGFIRTVRRGHDNDSQMTAFLMAAKRAGREVSGLSAKVSGQLIAAMRELENNVHEHSDSPETGILAYHAEPSIFEFVVADHGIGILRSLRRCSAYATLQDEGTALKAALKDGVSRYERNSRHGYGFRPIFIGLMNLHGELRFRSGDHAVTMEAISPTLAKSIVIQKVPIDGFFANVRCNIGHAFGKTSAHRVRPP